MKGFSSEEKRGIKFTPFRIALYIFTMAYSIAAIFLHNVVSRLVVGRFPEITGDFVPREYSVEFSFIVLGLLVFYFVYKIITGERKTVTVIYWVIYALCLIVFYLIISLHQVEIVHLIQYATVGYLFGLCLDPGKKKYMPGKILFLVSVIGVADELIQNYWITTGQGYLDLNDFVVNVLGAIAGILFYYGFITPPDPVTNKLRSFYNTKRFAFSAIFSAVVFLMLFMGNLKVSPPYPIPPGSYAVIERKLVIFMERKPGKLGSWQKHFVRGEYYTLTPLEGMLTIAGLVFLFSTFDPRFLYSFKEKLDRNEAEKK